MGFQSPLNEKTADPGLIQTVQPNVSAESVDIGHILTNDDISNPAMPFVYFVSRNEYMIVDGRALPNLRTVYLTPGIGRMGKTMAATQDMLAYQASLGRMLVPTNVATTAFGQDLEGYVVGHPHVIGHKHHTSVWQRFTRQGLSVYWESDKAGWLAFLEVCHGLLGGEVRPEVVEKALRPIRDELKALSRLPPYDMVAQERKAFLRSLHPLLADPSAPKPEPHKRGGKGKK